MENVSHQPPNTSQVQIPSPARTVAIGLGSVTLLAAGVALGIFLTFGPLSHASLALRLTAGLAPTLVALVAARALRLTLAEKPKVITDLEFLKKNIPPSGVKKLTMPYIDELSLGQDFTTDLHRMDVLIERETWGGDSSTKGRKERYQGLLLSEKEETPRIQESCAQAYYLFRQLGLEDEDITQLSTQFNQGLGTGTRNALANAYPEQWAQVQLQEVKGLDTETGVIYKISRRDGITFVNVQYVAKMVPMEWMSVKFRGERDPEQIFYLRATTEVNLTTGVGVTTITPPSKEVPGFDLS